MKRSLLTLVCLTAFFPLFSQPEPKNDIPEVIFKFSPQHLIRGGLWLSTEFLNKKHSSGNQIAMEAMYRRPSPGNNYTGIYEVSGFTLDYAYKHYINKLKVEKTLGKERVSGYYVGIFAQLGNYNQKVKYYEGGMFNGNIVDNSINTQSVYPGFLFGKQFSLGEGFFIDLSVGAGIRLANTELKTADPSYEFNDSPEGYFIYYNGLLPKVGMSLGFGF